MIFFHEATSIAAANSGKGAVTAKGSAKSARHPVRLTSCDGALPKADDKAFAKFLQTLDYPYVEETANPVYRMFLQQ